MSQTQMTEQESSVSELLKTNDAMHPSLNKVNVLSFLASLFVTLLCTLLLGANDFVLYAYALPFAGFVFAHFLHGKKRYGEALLAVFFSSLAHTCVLVSVYEIQYIEMGFFLLSIFPWFVLMNLRVLQVLYSLCLVCCVVFGFHLKHHNLLEIASWSASETGYFIALTGLFLPFYFFLTLSKKESLRYRQAIHERQEEIKRKNALIEEKSTALIELQKEKHAVEMANLQNDAELLQMNNQMKVKMKVQLIGDLQKLIKEKNEGPLGIKALINTLKMQVDEESKMDLLQANISAIGSGFKDRVKELFPQISSSELEMISYIKLGLNNKEIATKKNTSPNTVNVALFRLKKKCGFESTSEFKEYVVNL